MIFDPRYGVEVRRSSGACPKWVRKWYLSLEFVLMFMLVSIPSYGAKAPRFGNCSVPATYDPFIRQAFRTRLAPLRPCFGVQVGPCRLLAPCPVWHTPCCMTCCITCHMPGMPPLASLVLNDLRSLWFVVISVLWVHAVRLYL